MVRSHSYTHGPPGYGTAKQQRPSRVWALDLDFTLTHTHKYAQQHTHQSLTSAALQWACAAQRLNQLVLYSHVTVNMPTPSPDLRAFPSNRMTLTCKCSFLSVLSAFSRTCTCDVFHRDECKESSRVPFIALYPQVGSNRITDDAFPYGWIWGGTGKCTFIWTDQKQADFRLKPGMRAAKERVLTCPDSL